jgi:hypothetical protein
MVFRIHFTCSDRLFLADEPWDGWVEPLGSLKSDVTQMKIESRSAFYAIVGDTDFGHFICLPDWGIGSHLSDYSDLFCNKEMLVELLGPVDGVTVACALRAAHRAGMI